MRRTTSSTGWSLKAAGARRWALSMVNATSAWLREGRLAAPAKITSSMPPARMALAELAPITQRKASSRLDLPQPFGPTTPVTPGSIRNSVGSTKDLKPESRSRWNCTGGLAASLFGRRLAGRCDGGVELRRRLWEVFELLAVDEQGRRGIDAVLFGGASRARRNRFDPRLVGEAGVEVRLIEAVGGGDLLEDRLNVSALPAGLA